MKLEVGKRYLTSKGVRYDAVYIIEGIDTEYPMIMVNGKGEIASYTISGIYNAPGDPCWMDIVEEYIKPELICGYSREQWQIIMVGDFLCGFSNNVPQKALTIQTLSSIISAEEGHNFIACGGTTWANCSPVHDKGIRQPWFGGECPVPDSMMVLITWRDGSCRYGPAKKYDWRHADTLDDIVEFIYLKDGRHSI